MNQGIVLFFAAISCATGAGAQTAAPPEAAVQSVIRDYYVHWSNRDEARYRALLADDYVLLEHGEPMTVADDVRLMPKPGSTRTNAFDFRGVQIVGDVAYAHWFLDSKITDEKGARQRRWLESGVLRRSGSGWKIALVHSTRIEPGK